MRIGRALLGVGDGVIDRVLCVAGALVFSQAPEFIQQYLQRLGGHLDEARRQLAKFRSVAEQSGLTLDGLVNHTNGSGDPAVAKLGGVIAESAQRVQTLESAQAAITHASVWTRPFVFLRHADHEIARATWEIFRPAVPTTLEGALYAGIGMLVFLGTYHLLVRQPVLLASRRHHRRTAVATT